MTELVNPEPFPAKFECLLQQRLRDYLLKAILKFLGINCYFLKGIRWSHLEREKDTEGNACISIFLTSLQKSKYTVETLKYI